MSANEPTAPPESARLAALEDRVAKLEAQVTKQEALAEIAKGVSDIAAALNADGGFPVDVVSVP